MSFIVTGRDIPANCFRCPLDKGVWKQEQGPFILCRYTKEIVRYDDVPTDRRLPCCGLKEMPEKHGRLIDADDFSAVMKERQLASAKWLREAKDVETINRAGAVFAVLCEVKRTIGKLPTIVEAEGE